MSLCKEAKLWDIRARVTRLSNWENSGPLSGTADKKSQGAPAARKIGFFSYENSQSETQQPKGEGLCDFIPRKNTVEGLLKARMHIHICQRTSANSKSGPKRDH